MSESNDYMAAFSSQSQDDKLVIILEKLRQCEEILQRIEDQLGKLSGNSNN